MVVGITNALNVVADGLTSARALGASIPDPDEATVPPEAAATFENPHQYPVGIPYVIVNGVVAIDNGRHTGALAGRVIYGPGRK